MPGSAVFELLGPDIQHRLLRQQVAVMPVGHIVWDRDFRVCAWNAAAELIFGYPASEALGRHASFLLPAGDAQTDASSWERIVARGLTTHAIRENVTREGRLIRCRWTDAPLTGADAAGFAAFSLVQDVTRERELEREVLQAHRLNATALLTTGVAHDFNNLLTVIVGATDLLRELTAAEPAAARLVDDTSRAAHRAAEITRSLLAFGQGHELVTAPVDLGELIREFAPLLSSLLGDRIALDVAIAADAAAVLGERVSLQQVLLNLTVNARDAMPGGGRLAVKTAAWTVRGDRELPDGEYVALSVTDTGLGMDGETLARAFEPFFTTKAMSRGSGLGLSVIHGLIRRSGGAIHLDSEPGRGTTATVLLPRAEGPPAPDLHLVVDVRPSSSQTATVLLVDNDELVRTTVALLLRRSGYVVFEAASAEHALKHLAAAVTVDLCVMDATLPRHEGLEVAAALLAVRRDLPFIYTSGYDRATLALRGVRLPLDGPLMTKPFTREQLVATVRRVLDRDTAPQAVHEP